MKTAWPALLLLASCSASDADRKHELVRLDEWPASALGTPLERFDYVDLSGEAIEWDPGVGLRRGSDGAHPVPALVVHVFQPDCGACRNQARELERLRSENPDIVDVVGIAHRLEAPDVSAFGRDVGLSYPLVSAADSPWAGRWGRGDPLFIVDRHGRIVYVQVGFHPSDPATWANVVQDLGAGRDPRTSQARRDSLVVGESLPIIDLPVLAEEGRIRITKDGAGMLAIERAGKQPQHYRAAIGFFSRY